MVATAEKPKTDKVHAEPGRLLGEEHRWSERRAQIVASIAAAEATAGARVLDGGDTALRAQADELASQRAEVSGCDAAISEARRRRRGAILAVWQADAAALRRQARTLRQEADGRQKTTDGLLAQLREFEGCEYRPVVPPEAALAMQTGVGAAPGTTYTPSARTDALRAEAANLEAQAAALERRPVQESGGLRGDTREALLDQLRGLDPMTIGPAIASVEDWLSSSEAPVLEALRIRLARGQGGARDYEVVWRDGELERSRSRVSLREHGGSMGGPSQAA